MRTSKRLVPRNVVPHQGRQRALNIQASDYTKSILISEPIIWRQKDRWGKKTFLNLQLMEPGKQTPKNQDFISASTPWKSHGFTQLRYRRMNSWRDKKRPAASGDFITVLGRLEAVFSGPVIGIIML